MQSLGIIPARKGSQRFQNKHQALLLGKPMFAYTIEAALASTRLDRLVISSDDLELKSLADRYGVEFIERPSELASDTAALDDALRHTCRVLEERDGFRPDILLAMQGNVPVRKEGQIDEVIRRFKSLPDATAICTGEEVHVRPEWAKVMKDTETGEVEPFMAGYSAYRKQDYPQLFVIDGAVYGVRLDTLWAQEGNKKVHAWFGDRLHLLPQGHPMYSLEVDYPYQAQMAEFYLLRQHHADQWEKMLQAI